LYAIISIWKEKCRRGNKMYVEILTKKMNEYASDESTIKM